jgi:hypothetical protein
MMLLKLLLILLLNMKVPDVAVITIVSFFDRAPQEVTVFPLKVTPAPALPTVNAVVKPVKVLVPITEAAPPFKITPKPVIAVPVKVEPLIVALAAAVMPVPVPATLKVELATVVGVFTARPVAPAATVKVSFVIALVALVPAAAIVKAPPFRLEFVIDAAVVLPPPMVRKPPAEASIVTLSIVTVAPVKAQAPVDCRITVAAAGSVP